MVGLVPINTAEIERKRLVAKRLPSPAHRRALRSSAGVSQVDAAAACGVTRSTFCRWEQGTRTPRGEHLAAYVDLLDFFAELAG